MSVTVIDDKKIFDFVREVVLGEKNVEDLAKNFGDSAEIRDLVEGTKDLLAAVYPEDEDALEFDDAQFFFEEVEFGKIFISESENTVEAIENILAKISTATKILMNIAGDENKLEGIDFSSETEKFVEKFPDAEILWAVGDGQLKNKVRVMIVSEEI